MELTFAEIFFAGIIFEIWSKIRKNRKMNFGTVSQFVDTPTTVLYSLKVNKLKIEISVNTLDLFIVKSAYHITTVCCFIFVSCSLYCKQTRGYFQRAVPGGRPWTAHDLA